jgi:hypothetical protein
LGHADVTKSPSPKCRHSPLYRCGAEDETSALILVDVKPWLCLGLCIWAAAFWSHRVQWKPLIMITLGPALFDNNNRLITLSRGYKNLHYLTQFIVATFTYIRNNKIYVFKKTCVVLPVVCLHLVVPE